MCSKTYLYNGRISIPPGLDYKALCKSWEGSRTHLQGELCPSKSRGRGSHPSTLSQKPPDFFGMSVIVNPFQARLFWSSGGLGHNVAPFENHVSLVLIAYYYVFLNACPKLDHMTHLGVQENRFRCFRCSKVFFSKKIL